MHLDEAVRALHHGDAYSERRGHRLICSLRSNYALFSLLKNGASRKMHVRLVNFKDSDILFDCQTNITILLYIFVAADAEKKKGTRTSFKVETNSTQGP